MRIGPPSHPSVGQRNKVQTRIETAYIALRDFLFLLYLNMNTQIQLFVSGKLGAKNFWQLGIEHGSPGI